MKFDLRFVSLTPVVIMMCMCACKKKNNESIVITPPVLTVDSTYSPTDPATAATIGFFMDGWTPKSFVAPDTENGVVPTGAATDSLTINLNKVITKVSKYLYGNNSNLWMGQIVTQPTLMQYLKDLSPNIIRAPAGSVSDVYFWNGTDANPRPADAPATLLDAAGNSTSIGSWYGGNTASWTFSLANYYTMLAQTNSTGIITVNYGYARYGTSNNPVAAAAHLAADWVRYDNGRTKYWEIGNENFGNWEAGYNIDQTKNKDGQPKLITGALYGTHFKVFCDSMRAAATQIGKTIYIGALLYQQAATAGDILATQTWNVGVLQNAGTAADYFIIHDYFTPYNANTSAADILKTAKAIPLADMSYVKSQMSAAGVAIKPIAMTEWNLFASGSKQNTSFIAGMHVAKTLGEMVKNQFGQASRWDLANGYANGDDHGLFNSGDEPGAPLWNPRPAYFYQYYFQKFFGDRMVYDTLKAVNGDLSTYSSTFSSGQPGTVIINTGANNHIVAVDYQHFPAGSKFYWYVLTGGTDNGSFSSQVFVNGTGPSTASGGPLNYATLKAYTAPLKGTLKVAVPAMSAVFLVAEKR
jgi:hypothetical protein